MTNIAFSDQIPPVSNMFAFFPLSFQRQRIPLLIHILPHQFLNQLLVLHLGGEQFKHVRFPNGMQCHGRPV